MTRSTRQTAQLVLGTGLVPLAGMSLWLALIGDSHPWRTDTVFGLKTYAAVMLSFLGGTCWSAATGEDESEAPRAHTFAILPALAGWTSLMLPDAYSFAVLAVSFAGFGALDQFSAIRTPTPQRTGRTRYYVTLLAVASMITAFAATAETIVLPAHKGIAGYGVDAILPQHVSD